MQNIAIRFIAYFFAMTIFCYNSCYIAFDIFNDAISIKDITLSYVITEVSAILFKYLLSSQMHVLGFQL